ncbi:putative RNA 2'-phosphotransferase [Nonomuraea solani]|uniref:Probable RNA 2'-phosphotransferase n=1 Tax=Nonomuraea solani TaxID=1144553 RepID=A0A1H6EGA0_9ACTN|nr:RNA 2'-phosphotransferase [Nonomuraea solani]SEG96850.1 putative RNA 2'-phosphotransferase [Nonomuraea solani]
MEERRMVRISKYLARHLRHDPQRIGLTLDPAGWVEVETLLRAAREHGFTITPDELREVVAVNDKRRYAIEDGRIRASQGHTIPVDLGLPVVEPPEVLYHGTVGRFLVAIRKEGLRPMNRQHVHLSPDRETAVRVGSRRGAPVVLVVAAGVMHADGHPFRRSANGVWLADHVPPGYLRLPS